VLSGWSYGGAIISDYINAYGEDNIAGTNRKMGKNLYSAVQAALACRSQTSPLALRVYGTTQSSNIKNAFELSKPPPSPRTVPSTVASLCALSAATRELCDLLKKQRALL